MSERRARFWVAFGVLGAVVVLVAALGATARSAPSMSGPETFTVNVDGHNPKVNEAFLGYFPNVVHVHAGDTVVFHMVGNGEPHTVALGTLADAAVAAFAKLSPAQQKNPPKSALALDAKVPLLLPSGPGDAIQSSANPCVVASGPVGKAACPPSQAAFDGSQSFYDSGWLASNQKFTVHVSSSTRAGTYRFMCLLHRESMSGKIVVVPSSTPVASPAAQYATGVKALGKIETALAPAAALERQGKPPIPGLTLAPNSILAGSGAQNSGGGEITEFGPKSYKIPVGGSVTWWVIGPHSITFNSTKANNDIRFVAPDGTVHANPKALAPAGGPGEPSKPPKGGKGPISFVTVASASWNGQGFHNSGVFGNSFGPPVIEGYKLTFTRKGTYNYLCTVHDRMKGTIVVG